MTRKLSPEEYQILAAIHRESEEIHLWREFEDETVEHPWADYDRAVRTANSIDRLTQNFGMMARVARNEHCPPSILQRIYGHPLQRPDVLTEIASNPNTPQAVLAELAVHEDRWVAEYARRNPKLPAHIRATVALSE
jgi:hypothetical protein